MDGLCYCRYGSFADFVNVCPELKDRDRRIYQLRLQGYTLEQIGQEYEIKRERVNQILRDNMETICRQYAMATGRKWFDEDYYRYFYETYEFSREDITPWLGISVTVWNYMDVLGARQGKQSLEDALSDQNLDVALRLRIKNYLNRNKVCVDGIWVDKKQTELEQLRMENKLLRDFLQYAGRK